MNNKSYAVDIKDLCKSFNGKEVVRHIKLQIKSGEIYGFLGPNGSGKTTTMRMICGLLQPDCGSGHCLGYDINKDTLQIKQHVGYMAQDFSLYDDLTIRENLTFFCKLYGSENIKQRVDEMIQKMNFDEHKHKLAGQLSGGWKNRLALAAAIIHKPRLLLLDEPTSGIDPAARRKFWDEIHRLSEQEGITTLVSTHYMDEAQRCHRLSYLFNGDILTRGSVSEIINQSGLTLWIARGENLQKLSAELKKSSAVEQAILFGEKLHIIGSDANALQAAIKPFQTDAYQFTAEPPTLEDVFINLGDKVGENSTF